MKAISKIKMSDSVGIKIFDKNGNLKDEGKTGDKTPDFKITIEY